MTNLPMFPEHNSENDNTPLPLLVAKKWGFPLAFHIVDGQYLYAIQDWVRGLLGEEDIRYVLSKLKQHKSLKEMWKSLPRLKYKATDGKIYPRDFCTDENLYLMAQYLRITHDRPLLNEIRQFLAKAGVFVDEMRLDPKTVLTSGAITADQALDAVIQMYRDQGRSDEWIQARMEGKIKRNEFVMALKAAVASPLAPHHYALATDEMYVGLWKRTAAQLKKELNLAKNASLRDHQPMLGLEYQRIAEGVAAKKLGDRQELTWDEARAIIKMVATFIGRQAKETSELMEMDLATGRPLLTHG